MRKKRSDRRDLLRRVKELETENAALRVQGGARAEDAETPVICGRGCPVRTPAFRAKSLEEAKRIITSGDRR